MKKLVLILLLFLSATALADRFEYIANVDIEIPDNDSTGIRDTIFVDQHVQISDINFYVGVGRPGQGWAEEVLITVLSPQGGIVWLNNWQGEEIFWYDCWYDTDRQVDGPGSLQDYNGSDAFGPWEMHCFDIFQDYTLHWYSWRIEVIGDPLENLAESKSLLPTKFDFSKIYPNPFNSQISIEYGLPTAAEVSLFIYDIQGRLVKTIPCGALAPGYHNIIWDATNDDNRQVSSGVYLLRVAAGEERITRKITLLK
jgi:subtilisin-like proprotein convertase family protein